MNPTLYCTLEVCILFVIDHLLHYSMFLTVQYPEIYVISNHKVKAPVCSIYRMELPFFHTLYKVLKESCALKKIRVNILNHSAFSSLYWCLKITCIINGYTKCVAEINSTYNNVWENYLFHMLISLTSYDWQNTYIWMLQCKYLRRLFHMHFMENILPFCMGFAIITAVSRTITAFCDLTPCNLINGDRRFGG